MNASQTGLAANLVGIAILLLACFGVDVDEDTRAKLLAGASALGLVINQVLILWAQHEQPPLKDNELGPGTSQRGCASAPLLAALAAMTIALIACSVQAPQTPRQALLAAYATAQSTAQAIEVAKRDNVIDAAQRDQLLDRVRQVRVTLETARLLFAANPEPGSANESTALAHLRAAEQMLRAVQSALPKEQSP